ncbi:MAG: DsbA family protein [Henriciella sp.]|jgi:2-hydroxychromene-2-carboxylate isomerase
MSIKSSLRNKVARHLFSLKRRDAKRRKAERARQVSHAPHMVDYYHELGDPYSHLMVHVLPDFCRRYEIELKVHIAPPPADWAAPDRERLEAYSRRDAALLAVKAGVDYSDTGSQPSKEALAEGNAALLQAVSEGTFLQRAPEIGAAVWQGQTVLGERIEAQEVAPALAAAATRREAHGHFLGATLYYAGEWYWGVDRLHYLESRLRALGAGKAYDTAPIFVPPVVPTPAAARANSERSVLHWYLSFRSPYTGIVAGRIKALADAYGAELRLRYVLPMVMRGMQVLRAKGFYIMSDAMREAERLGIPFGKMCDPLGKPVERGYAILHKAIELGKGYDFVQSFLSGVWAEGIDAGSDRGLKEITKCTELTWAEMQPLLGGDHWRADAEANQAEMFGHGIWGVPSFRVGDTAIWGQDRLWVIEDALAAEQNKTK